MVAKEEFDKTIDGIRSEFVELCTNTSRTLEEYFELQERQFVVFVDQAQTCDAHNQSIMVRAIIQQLQISQDKISLSICEEMTTQFPEMDSKLDQMCTDTGRSLMKGKSPVDQAVSALRRPHLETGDPSSPDSEFIKRDISKFRVQTILSSMG
jgi:hypothetical protein